MKTVKVGNIAKIFNGYAFKSPEYSDDPDGGFQVIRITNVQNGYISNDNQKFIKLSNKALERFVLAEGDILVSLTGNVGRFGKIKRENLPAVLNQRVGKVIIQSKEVFPDYLFHVLNSNMVESELLGKGKGIAQKNIGSSDIEDIEIPLPPIEDQKRIVKILDQADALRQKRKQAFELLDEYLKSTFLEMFGDPVKNNKNWQIEALFNSLVFVKNGLTRRGNNRKEEKDIVLRLKDIRSNFIEFNDLDRITLNEKEKELFRVVQNDLLFIRVNGNPAYVGRCAVFNGCPEPVYYNDHIMRVRINIKKLNPVFLTYYLNSSFGKSEIKKYRKTSAGQHTINQEGLGKVKLYIPNISFQNQFVSIIEKVEILKQKMLAQSEELENQFQVLMQKAFKGAL